MMQFAASVFAVFLFLASAPAIAGCRAGRVAEFPLTLAAGRVFIPVTVNDTQGQFLLDTGAFHSMIDARFATLANVRWDLNQPLYTLNGLGGNTLPVHAGHLRMLELGGIKVADREMPIHDFGPELRFKDAKLDGLLGADLIDLFDVELDFASGRVALWRLFDCKEIEPLHWAGDYAEIPMRRRPDKHIEIPIWLDGAELEAMLDTGAGGLLLSRQAAHDAGVTDEAIARDTQATMSGIGGSRPLPRHLFHTLLIGKETYRDVYALINDRPARELGAETIVGLDFLRGHRAWLSYGTETLFLQPQDGDAKN